MTRELSRRRLLMAGGSVAGGAAFGVTGEGTAAAGPSKVGAATNPNGTGAAAAWQSTKVRYNSDGRLIYPADAEGNRIPDFSHAGYRNGNRPLPLVRTKRRIAPMAGDNTAHIQAAIDAVATLPRDSSGFRGAVELAKGDYPVAGTLKLNATGVVLRGQGDEVDGTVIRATGNTPEHRDVIVVGGGGSTRWAGEVAGTRSDITTDRVQVGARSFEVADATNLKPGANIVIVHPCTEAWLASIDHGATATDDPWTVGSQPIVYNRFVRKVEGNTITLDVPVFEHLRKALSQSYVYQWDRAGLVTNVGVEKLRIDIEYAGDPDQDEAHAWNAVKLRQVEDVWVRDCTFLHFAKAGVETTETTRATIRGCRAIDPVSVITGGLRYNFNTESYSQQILFIDCYATKARHAFVSNGTSSASGVVFLRGTSEGSLASSEGHRRWSQGLLWDNHREISPAVTITMGIYNRGSYGTGHGWATSHSVGWNCDMAGKKLVVQKPPTAQNYAIGCSGQITGDGPFEQPAGFIEGANQPGLFPKSLYLAQYADRHH